MARSYSTYRRNFTWPWGQVMLWTILILAAGCTIMGVFAEFIDIQNKMQLEVPW
jgi:hypothetical protein